MEISLTDRLERFVREQVHSGAYDSPSSVVQDALRRLMREEVQAQEALKADIALALEQAERGDLVDWSVDEANRRRDAAGR